MASLSFKNIQGADWAVLLITIFAYALITYGSLICAIYLAYTRPGDPASERAIDAKWYKWKKQYIWLEVWFRFHIIWVFSLVVIFSFENSSWPVPSVILSLVFFISTTILLKWASRLVEERIPSAEVKKQLYSFVTNNTIRGMSTGDDFMEDYRSKKQLDIIDEDLYDGVVDDHAHKTINGSGDGGSGEADSFQHVLNNSSSTIEPNAISSNF